MPKTPLIAGVTVGFLIILTTLRLHNHTSSKPPESSSGVSYAPPEISYENRKPVGDKLDLSTINPQNAGNYLDLDNDGTLDHLIMRGNTLFFAKGLGGDKYASEIPVLIIKGDIMAYVVQTETSSDGKPLNVIRFWNSNRDGYFQRCLGVNPDGIPYFGEIESQ